MDENETKHQQVHRLQTGILLSTIAIILISGAIYWGVAYLKLDSLGTPGTKCLRDLPKPEIKTFESDADFKAYLEQSESLRSTSYFSGITNVVERTVPSQENMDSGL